MKKILIKAYTELNLGDDLFINILLNRYKNTNFIVFSNFNYKNVFSNNNLKVYKLNLLLNIFNKILRKLKIKSHLNPYSKLKQIDAVVEIGGSIFIENKNYIADLKNREFLLNYTNGNYYILGSNFGQYSSSNFKNKYELFFSKCKFVCFRDSYSYNLFAKLNNVYKANDIVFSLKDNNSSNNNYILFSIIKPSLRKELKDKDDEYYSKIIESSVELIKKGKNIKFISFCKKEGDEEAITHIINKIPKIYCQKVSFYNYSGNLNSALDIIKNSEIIVATRFHAMILGFVYQKKVLPIAYSKKTINVLDDLGFLDNFIDFNNLNELTENRILNSKVLDLSKLEKAKEDSLNHFSKLDAFLS